MDKCSFPLRCGNSNGEFEQISNVLSFEEYGAKITEKNRYKEIKGKKNADLNKISCFSVQFGIISASRVYHNLYN